jgi:hypothetical protein
VALVAAAMFGLPTLTLASGGGGHAAPAKPKESGGHGGGGGGGHGGGHGAAEEAPAVEQQGNAFKLGEFTLKVFRPVEREKGTLHFVIWVEVDEAKVAGFADQWMPRQHRVRNQVITSARLVHPSDFDDPTLHAFRRRIYLRLRRAVPELPIKEVFITDFSYIVE